MLAGQEEERESGFSFRRRAFYPSSHNHGSEKWVPPIVAAFQTHHTSIFHFHDYERKTVETPSLPSFFSGTPLFQKKRGEIIEPRKKTKTFHYIWMTSYIII